MKINTVFLAMLLLFVSKQAQAQTRATGLKWNDPSYAAIPQLSAFKGSRFDEVDLPTFVSLKEFCPYTGDQGQVGSCVAWASAYAAYTIQQAIENGWTDKNQITQNAFSAMFVYNQIKVGGCLDGSCIGDAAELLKTKGDVPFAKFAVADCNVQPASDLFSLANDYRIKDYVTLFSFNETNPDVKINEVKASLNEKHPVVIGMNITTGFMKLTSSTDIWNPAEGNTFAGGHAMCVIGYDDTKGAFEILNSWGKNWGNGGYMWVKYEDFAQNVRYGLALYINKVSPNPNSDETVELAGTFTIKKAISSTSFENKATRKTGSYYELVGGCKLNDKFRVIAISETEENYMYVFSIDPVYKAESHFPHISPVPVPPAPTTNAMAATNRYKLDHSGLTPDERAEVIIPDVKSAMKKSKPGADYLCILYTSQEIKADEYKSLMDALAQGISNGKDIDAVLAEKLGKRLIPKDKINYDNNNMSFTAKSTQGNVVPLILKVEAN